MAKFEVTVSIGLAGCRQRATVEIPDDVFEGMTEEEQDTYLNKDLWDYVVDNIVDWGYKKIE